MGNDVKIIVAAGQDGAIGLNGNLIWRIPEDLKRFKALTSGNVVIMGRKTWESLPKKPLPGRRNIVLSQKKGYEAPGAEVVDSPQEALKLSQGKQAFIIGGAEIYNLFMPLASEIYLTLVKENCDYADARLNIDLAHGWGLEESSPEYQTQEGIPYQYLIYKREQDTEL